MIKGMMENGEILALSYGMGIYRITSIDNLTLESKSLSYLQISDLLKTGEDTYIGISRVGHIPSHIELSIQETEEFRQDEKYAISNGSEAIRNRFYELHRVSVVG
jgi:hypothetical protein